MHTLLNFLIFLTVDTINYYLLNSFTVKNYPSYRNTDISSSKLSKRQTRRPEVLVFAFSETSWSIQSLQNNIDVFEISC